MGSKRACVRARDRSLCQGKGKASNTVSVIKEVQFSARDIISDMVGPCRRIFDTSESTKAGSLSLYNGRATLHPNLVFSVVCVRPQTHGDHSCQLCCFNGLLKLLI